MKKMEKEKKAPKKKMKHEDAAMDMKLMKQKVKKSCMK